MIRQRNIFLTRDNMEFRTMQEAEEHEAELKFLDWYGEHPLISLIHEQPVWPNSILNWLQENREEVLKLYGYNADE